MLDFSHPWLLCLALVVPYLVWRWLTKPRVAIRFPDNRLVAALPAGRERWTRLGGAAFRAVGLLLLIGAMAGPRWPDPRTRIPTEGIAIQMLLDISGSMAEPDYVWHGIAISRLEAAKHVFRLFVVGGDVSPSPYPLPEGEGRVRGRPNDLVGLVTFATWPETACPLTLSHAVLLRLLANDRTDVLRPRTVPGESHTNIGDAIAWGLRGLESAAAPRKVLILLSDGEHNVTPPALTPRQAAQLAANLGVPIYVIDVGGETNPSESSTAVPHDGAESLQAVARLTGGQYFEARDTESLLNATRDIDRMERGRIESFVYRRYFDVYPWMGLAALACWGLVFSLENTVWRRVP